MDTAAKRLQTDMAAMRLSFTWFGVSKALTPGQKSEAADTFDADKECLSAGKKIIDTKDTRYLAVTSVRSQIKAYWEGASLPYPEKGIRLVPRDDVESVVAKMERFRAELLEAVDALNDALPQIKQDSEVRMGRLYNAGDYPTTLLGMFDIAWEFPSVEPPEYLKGLSPELYAAECRRVQNRFDDAVAMAEQAFLTEISDMVSSLSDKLSGSEDGKPKVVKQPSLDKLSEFFSRFRHMNIRSNADLDAIVERAEQVLQGVPAQMLRDHSELRQEVATQLSAVQAGLDGMLVDKPRRNIQRRAAVVE